MEGNVIEVSGLTKVFGRIRAVDTISFKVERGQIFGILGPNGSGKTTTLSIVLSLLRPTAGTVALFGDQDLASGRRRIGATLESTGFFPGFSGLKNLKMAAAIKGASIQQIHENLQLVGLYDRMHSKYGAYSMGMRQRLAIASALLGDPEVIIFDEPTNGMDPRGIIEIRELIRRLKSEGKTIVLASHLLDEMQKICTDVIIMERGKIIKSGSLAELLTVYENLEDAFMELTSTKL